MAIFLDDGWAIVQDRESCRIKAQAVRAEFCIRYFENCEKRIVKIINSIDHIIEADVKVSARDLSSFRGQIISTGPVVGNIGRIMTRHCVLFTLCRDNWDSISLLDDYCKEELYFWKEKMVNINTRYCFVSKVPSYFVYSDASATGVGAIIDFNNDFVCHKMWSENERGQSSTWRELSVESSFQSFPSVLEGSHVKLFTDSQVAAKIVEVGSMKQLIWQLNYL